MGLCCFLKALRNSVQGIFPSTHQADFYQATSRECHCIDIICHMWFRRVWDGSLKQQPTCWPCCTKVFLKICSALGLLIVWFPYHYWTEHTGSLVSAKVCQERNVEELLVLGFVFGIFFKPLSPHFLIILIQLFWKTTTTTPKPLFNILVNTMEFYSQNILLIRTQ